jgi:hypothetical protein
MWFLYIVLCFLSVADYFATASIVHIEGSLAELNPMMRFLIETCGMIGVGYFKAITLLFLLLIILFAREKHHKLINAGLYFAFGLYLINAIWTWYRIVYS